MTDFTRQASTTAVRKTFPAEKRNLFQDFLTDRSTILEVIREFLSVVLMYCLNMEDELDCPRDVIATKNVSSLIESLCLIHGLYGYPAKSNSSENTGVNKRAVRDILNEIEEKNKENVTRKFVYYCEEVATEEFWQFKFSDGTSSLESSLREPAHIFLQMVRDLFRIHKIKNHKNAAEIGRIVLEGLPDGNHLKPVVWAEHKERQDCYGVSLGVRPFLRPLYLYIKMNQLRNVENCCYDSVKPEDVNAFQSVKRRRIRCVPSADKSPYKENENKPKVKPPCVSCKIFFKGLKERKKNSLPPFANCAEYDVIRTPKLDDVLSSIEGTKSEHWIHFKSACKEHFKAFNELTQKLDEPGNSSQNELLETYYKNTRNAKILKYQWVNYPKHGSYELVAC